MTKYSIVRQDNESYSSLEILYAGIAKQLTPAFPGDIVFQFPAVSNGSECTIRFNWVSSVLYSDEMLWSQKSYPYFKDVNSQNGVFLVHGSTYLERISPYFPDHLHYIYFDREFNWHITARKIEVI